LLKETAGAFDWARTHDNISIDTYETLVTLSRPPSIHTLFSLFL